MNGYCKCKEPSEVLRCETCGLAINKEPLEPIDEKAIEKCLDEPIYSDEHTKMWVMARDKKLIAKLICAKFGIKKEAVNDKT